MTKKKADTRDRVKNKNPRRTGARNFRSRLAVFHEDARKAFVILRNVAADTGRLDRCLALSTVNT